MVDYEKMYFELFDKLTDILLDIQKIQQSVEEIYIEDESKLTTIQEPIIKNCNG